MPNDAIPAATLILVRQNGSLPELLMTVRAESMAFAPGALVFPGGRIDPGDVDLGRGFGLDGAARVAAIRETLEETGLPASIQPPPPPGAALAMQKALNGGAPFADLLAESGCALDPDRLTPFARWVPGHEVSRRFDTRFYLAEAGDLMGMPNPEGGECTAALWISAQEALDRAARGDVKLIYPTRKNLERLAQFKSFEEMRSDALAHPATPITPAITSNGGVASVTIPAGLGYPLTTDPADNVWRG